MQFLNFLKLGGNDADTNAGVVAQVLSVQGVANGGTSNQAGKNFTIQASRGKGSGAGGAIVFQVTVPGSPGSGLNALQDTLTLAGDADRTATFAGILKAGVGVTQLTNGNGNLLPAAFGSQANSVFLASPSGTTGVPTFRAITDTDLPQLTHGKLTIPFCEAQAAGSQSIANTTLTYIDLGTENADTDNMHSTVSNISRITASTTGKYLVVGSIPFSGVPGACRILARIYKNRTSVVAAIDQQISSGSPAFNLTAIVDLSIGDYVEMAVYHDAGSSFSLFNGSGLQAIMSAVRIR